MSTEDQHNVRNWVIAGGTAAAAIVAALAYFLPRDGSAKPPSIEVKAEGPDSVAAGRDVSIKESTTVDAHDYDSDRRRDAVLYLKTAHEACQSLATRIGALTADSKLEPANLSLYNPLELEPAEVIAQEYGEKVYNDISTRMEKTREDFKPVSKVMVSNLVTQMTGSGHDQSKVRSNFDADKKTWLDDTTSLCTYLSNVQKGGV